MLNHAERPLLQHELQWWPLLSPCLRWYWNENGNICRSPSLLVPQKNRRWWIVNKTGIHPTIHDHKGTGMQGLSARFSSTNPVGNWHIYGEKQPKTQIHHNLPAIGMTPCKIRIRVQHAMLKTLKRWVSLKYSRISWATIILIKCYLWTLLYQLAA